MRGVRPSTFPLDDWRTALAISQAGHAHGKLILLPDGADGAGVTG